MSSRGTNGLIESLNILIDWVSFFYLSLFEIRSLLDYIPVSIKEVELARELDPNKVCFWGNFFAVNLDIAFPWLVLTKAKIAGLIDCGMSMLQSGEFPLEFALFRI